MHLRSMTVGTGSTLGLPAGADLHSDSASLAAHGLGIIARLGCGRGSDRNKVRT